jgi:hypothetical protein
VRGGGTGLREDNPGGGGEGWGRFSLTTARRRHLTASAPASLRFLYIHHRDSFSSQTTLCDHGPKLRMTTRERSIPPSRSRSAGAYCPQKRSQHSSRSCREARVVGRGPWGCRAWFGTSPALPARGQSAGPPRAQPVFKTSARLHRLPLSIPQPFNATRLPWHCY